MVNPGIFRVLGSVALGQERENPICHRQLRRAALPPALGMLKGNEPC